MIRIFTVLLLFAGIGLSQFTYNPFTKKLDFAGGPAGPQGPAGSGLNSLNGLTANPQLFVVQPDTTLTMSIVSVSNTHTFQFAWNGTFAKTRLPSTILYSDQVNSMTNYLDWTQIAAPTTPAGGLLRVYAKTGSGLCWKDSTGTETCGGAGGGGGAQTPWTSIIDAAGYKLTNVAVPTATDADGAIEIRETQRLGSTGLPPKILFNHSGQAAPKGLLGWNGYVVPGSFYFADGTGAAFAPIAAALIESKLGGFKFPDGTTQTTASGGGGGHTIQDEGTPLTARTNLNFVGTGVAVTDDGTNTVVTVGATGGTSFDDLKLTKTSGTVISVAAGRYAVNSDTYLQPAATFTVASMNIVSVTNLNPLRFTLSNADYTTLIDGDSSMITVTGGSGCTMMGGVHTVTKWSNPSFEVNVADINATGCSGLAGRLEGTGTGTCYIQGTDDGLIQARCPSASGIMLRCTGNCTYIQEAIPEFEANNVKLGISSIAAGTPSTWDVVTDTRGVLQNRRILAGDGVQLDTTQTIMSVTGNVAKRNGGNTFTGTQDFTGATVTGISGGGGGGGVLVDHIGLGSPVSLTAASDTILSLTAIPANTIAAGECLQWEAYGGTSGGTPNVTYKIWYGTANLTLYATTGLGPHRMQGSVCYTAASTTAGMVYGFLETPASGDYLVTGGAQAIAFSAADVATARNLYITGNAVSPGQSYTPAKWTVTKLKR